MCAAKGVDHECCVMVVKTGFVIDGKDHENCSRNRKKNIYFIVKTLLICTDPWMKVEATIIVLKIKHCTLGQRRIQLIIHFHDLYQVITSIYSFDLNLL